MHLLFYVLSKSDSISALWVVVIPCTLRSTHAHTNVNAKAHNVNKISDCCFFSN